jgi:hypothetical protein
MASDDRSWAIGAAHDERWAGYLDPDTGMLRTLSAEPMRPPDELREFEDCRATLRAIELRLNPFRGDFGLEHLQAIHRHLFQDVYPWAGEVRTVSIRKGDQGFLRPEHAGIVVDGADRMMREDGMLASGMDNARWSSLLADRFNDVNTGGIALLEQELLGTNFRAALRSSPCGSRARRSRALARSAPTPARRTSGRGRASTAPPLRPVLGCGSSSSGGPRRLPRGDLQGCVANDPTNQRERHRTGTAGPHRVELIGADAEALRGLLGGHQPQEPRTTSRCLEHQHRLH